jgi:AraC family transcriptional activator of pobA
MGRTRERVHRDGGVAAYTYAPAPGAPLVTVQRFDPASVEPLPGPHVHDYLALAYFDAPGGRLRSGDREWQLGVGDAFVSAPGDVTDPRGLREARGWAVFFPPEALGSGISTPFLAWRAHPLLFPFIGGVHPGLQHVRVPAIEQPIWAARLAGLERELAGQQAGHREAVTAQLTLLLVDVARLLSDVVGELRIHDESVLADVFTCIEDRYRDRLSLRDVASAVSLTPGHLTTVVRQKTGRTVLAWIAERRMVEARRELTATDRSVEEVARDVGFDDPAYFVRSFRRAHGTTPAAWRRAARA